MIYPPLAQDERRDGLGHGGRAAVHERQDPDSVIVAGTADRGV
jgi:hypothetical protein